LHKIINTIFILAPCLIKHFAIFLFPMIHVQNKDVSLD